MGWLRLVGSLKLQVSFAKEPYTKDLHSSKRPIILRSLLPEATPYSYINHICRNVYISVDMHSYLLAIYEYIICVFQVDKNTYLDRYVSTDMYTLLQLLEICNI